MSIDRNRLLEEMGLAPVWRLREKPDPGSAMQDSQSSADPPRPALPRSPAAAAAERAHSPSPAGAKDERGARILRMDWPELKAAVASCEACALARTRTHPVFGVGDERAEWLLVGEAPGAEEDARGEPFVGQAGRLLDNMLASIGLARSRNVYIANVLKCRPPRNRNPEAFEVAQCNPHLARQIALIRPRPILARGRFAVQSLLETEATIASLRGKLHRYQGVPLVVTYHPAYLLRNLPDKAKAWEDLCFARRVMAELRSKAGGD
ncbi:MAG: uracil-DNA glycosylase [Betaproteobacteria bacterium]|nr:uracil-DNA glycosylase [Betaproteobacteria bacterium]